jgi:hypothetical protein
MKKSTMSAVSLTLVIAVVLVVGALVTPYHYAMAGRSHDASHSNTARSNNGDHPHPPHTAVNTTRSNIKSSGA